MMDGGVEAGRVLLVYPSGKREKSIHKKLKIPSMCGERSEQFFTYSYSPGWFFLLVLVFHSGAVMLTTTVPQFLESPHALYSWIDRIYFFPSFLAEQTTTMMTMKSQIRDSTVSSPSSYDI